ncbi:hypothetical protein HPB47_007289 [Ixodes persulcatus]|uniref:Uncharacterized protein n=1 Tax=Ixodes persulcatus TaxID=34615 RepID=A0AC60P815_IXOPE|nr:hypothetical protein HPB47_007289 [Ixodes persulcatus]
MRPTSQRPLGPPYEGGGPQQSTQATPGIEMTDLPENQLLSETPFSEDGTGQLQNTPLLMQVNLPYHQVLSTPEETRQDPRLRRKNERSRSPHRTSRRGDEEPTQRTHEMQDGGHLTPVRLTEQDGDRPPQTSAPPLNEGTFQGYPLKQTKPPAPPNLLSASETNDDKEWPLLEIFSRKRKFSQPMRIADESTPRLFPVQTMVLRSVGKKEVSAFTGKEIREAIESAGIQAQADYTVHRNEKANALAITTRDPLLTEKLLKIKAIRQGEDTNALQPYKALAGNQCRGVVYLRGQNNEVTPEQLQEDIDYMHEVLPVRENRPRPLVCFKCHAIGHKKDVCPREKERCGTCGSEHDGMEKCSQIPKCANCGGAHVATSNECPKRAIPPRRPAKKTGEKSAQGIDKPILPPPAGRPRQAAQAAIHNKEISQLLKHVEVFYTDAARDDSGRTAIAWHSPTRNETSNQLTSRTRSTCMAELLAILFAVETATTMPRPEISETRIYTDSQEAVRALGHSSTCNVTVAHIRELVRLAGAKQKITIAWIPGHASIPGNERADGAARALLQASIQPSQGPVPSPVQRDVSTKEVFDLYETKKQERNARKAQLAALLPANPHPIPRGLPRWERVALHRLQTRTMLTPVWFAKFHRPTEKEDTGPDPRCPHCGVPATCDHLVWFCPETSNERAAAINNLPPSLRPKTLWELTHPRSSEPADRTAIFSSIISYLRSSGIGWYI